MCNNHRHLGGDTPTRYTETDLDGGTGQIEGNTSVDNNRNTFKQEHTEKKGVMQKAIEGLHHILTIRLKK